MGVDGWTPARLGDLVEIKHGWPFKSDLYDQVREGRPIVVSVGNFRYTGGFRFDETTINEYRGTYPEDYELVAGDILLIMTCQTAGGEILGVPARVPTDGQVYLHNQRLGKVVVRDSTRVDSGFLYQLFRSAKFNRELVISASGTKILHTAPSRIEAFQFDLPPLTEQHAIARILGALDDKIELNRRMNETAEAMARAVFKSWFVDFDPVRAKAEGRDIDLPKHFGDLFPDSFEDSELGEIPKGWATRGLDEIADFLNGLALQKYSPGEGPTLPVIKIAQLRKGDTEGADRCNADLPAGYTISDGDVLFSWSGSLECALWAGGKGALNQHIFKVTSALYPKWFYYLWIHQHLQDFRHIAAGKATTMGHIQRHHLTGAKVIVPGPSIINAGGKMIAPLIETIMRCRVESHTLAALRDALLPKLVSGEIRTGSAEKSLRRAGV